MKPRAALLLVALLALPASAEDLGLPRSTVQLKYGEYRKLVQRPPRPPVDAVLAKAHYSLKFDALSSGGDTAHVVARWDLKTLRNEGWKQVQLVGGAAAITRFQPPSPGAQLVVRDPGIFYIMYEGVQDGELVLEFDLPVVAENGTRRLSFVPPAVPLATLDAGEQRVVMEPEAAVRGGGPLTVTLARAAAAPSPRASAAGEPRADVVVDRLEALFTLADGRVRLRETLVVDVRAVPLERILLHKPKEVLALTVREEGTTPLLDESVVGRPLDPEGREERVELPLRAPLAGRVITLVIEADVRADPDAGTLALAPVTLEDAAALTEGHVAVASLLPHRIELTGVDGGEAVLAERLPASFARSDVPVRVAVALKTPRARLELTQRALPAEAPARAAIQKLDVITDLSGAGVITRYRAMVTAGAERTLVVSLPNQDWKLEDVRGVTTNPMATARPGSYLLALKPAEGGPLALEFDVRHPYESPRGAGDVTLALARFDAPARDVTWSVVEPDSVRVYDWRGRFADRPAPRENFLYRFAMGCWSGLAQGVGALADPILLFWVVVVIIGVTMARWAALGRLPLEASIAQIAFVGAVVVLGALFVHVLTTAGAGTSTEARRDERVDGRTMTPLQGTPLQGTPLQGTPLQGTPLQGVPALPPPPRGTSLVDELELRRTLPEDASAPASRGLAELPPPPITAPPTLPVLAPTTVAAPPPAVSTLSGTAPGLTSLPPPSPVAIVPIVTTPGMGPPALKAAEPPRDTKPTFARALLLPEPEEIPPVALEASYIERKYERLPAAMALVLGLVLFLVSFLYRRDMVDGLLANVTMIAALAVLWFIDQRFPFATLYAAWGFGVPVLLVAGVRGMSLALETWESWREEGERLAGHGDEERRTTGGGGSSWSASFPRSGDRNEVPIKDIFADPPAAPAAAAALAGGEDISFVTEEEEEAPPPGGGGTAEARAPGGEAP